MCKNARVRSMEKCLVHALLLFGLVPIYELMSHSDGLMNKNSHRRIL